MQVTMLEEIEGDKCLFSSYVFLLFT